MVRSQNPPHFLDPIPKYIFQRDTVSGHPKVGHLVCYQVWRCHSMYRLTSSLLLHDC